MAKLKYFGVDTGFANDQAGFRSQLVVSSNHGINIALYLSMSMTDGAFPQAYSASRRVSLFIKSVSSRARGDQMKINPANQLKGAFPYSNFSTELL